MRGIGLKLVLWDIDGTLLRTAGAGGKSMYAALNSHFGSTPEWRNITFAGRTDRSIIRDLLAHGRVDVTEENIATLIAAYLAELPGQLNQPGTGALPGVTESLEFIASHPKASQGLLTGNLREGAYKKLSAYGLDHYFSFGGFGDLHMERDDVARDALRAAQEFGLKEVQDVWVIGDTPNDIKCARAIDAKVIAVATGTYSRDELSKYQPDILFDDFSQFSDLIETLEL